MAEYSFNVTYTNEEIEGIRTTRLVRKARALDVPLPSGRPYGLNYEDADENWWLGSATGTWLLTDGGFVKIRDAIRAEERARGHWWTLPKLVPWVVPMLTTALVAVWTVRENAHLERQRLVLEERQDELGRLKQVQEYRSRLAALTVTRVEVMVALSKNVLHGQGKKAEAERAKLRTRKWALDREVLDMITAIAKLEGKSLREIFAENAELMPDSTEWYDRIEPKPETQ